MPGVRHDCPRWGPAHTCAGSGHANNRPDFGSSGHRAEVGWLSDTATLTHHTAQWWVSYTLWDEMWWDCVIFLIYIDWQQSILNLSKTRSETTTRKWLWHYEIPVARQGQTELLMIVFFWKLHWWVSQALRHHFYSNILLSQILSSLYLSTNVLLCIILYSVCPPQVWQGPGVFCFYLTKPGSRGPGRAQVKLRPA